MNSFIEIARYWAHSSFFDRATRQEVRSLLDQQDEKELADRFSNPLEFGTAGMRGIMAAGVNRMNRYTVRQATEGLACYLEKQADPVHAGVVIGYDSRHNSAEFARAASEVLAAHGIPVFLFQEMAPTPMVSFEVIQQKAMAGIVITASHNPADYNGYKVYWKNGGQIIPPVDEGIIAEVRKVTDLTSIAEISIEKAIERGIIRILTEDSDDRYLEALENQALGDPAKNGRLGVIYTSLHGTGIRSVPPLLRRRGFRQLKLVEAQCKPDSDFSTVRSPNPEDARVFELAIAAATPEYELILTNDPDADRLGVMVRHNTKWRHLNGNQVGAILLDYWLSRLRVMKKLPRDGVFIQSNVSSPLGAKIARAYGLTVVETLTGFKWMRAEASRIEKEGTGTFVFAMEESLGYLAGNHCGDKDGVWAALAFAEMTAYLKARALTPLDRLQQLHQQFGIHLDDLENRTLPGIDGRRKIEAIMQGFRQHPPSVIGGIRLLRITDLLQNVVIRPGSSETLPGPNLPVSDVLVFQLEDEARVIVRPSGTEPKIKYYFNLCGADEPTLQKRLDGLKNDLLSDFETTRRGKASSFKD